MRSQLQHYFHPLHLWCLCGGQCSWCFRLYEKWLWQPLLRNLLTEKSKREKTGLERLTVPTVGEEVRRTKRRPE